MLQTRWHERIYAINFALLFTHEIDSAYWQEWNLFGVPGGIQLFLVINLAMFAVAIVGYRNLLQGRPSGYWLSFLLAVSGLFAFSIHSYFLLRGHPEFTQPASEILLVAILVASLAQMIVGIMIYIKKEPLKPI